MKKQLRSILCLLLCLATLWNNVLPVLATDAQEDNSKSIWESASGSFSTGLTWKLSEGVLTISGTGSIPDSLQYGFSPWENSEYYIREVVVSEGVCDIGDYAFHNCYNLTRIYLPESIGTVSSTSFDGCTALKEVYFAGSSVQWNRSSVSQLPALQNVTIHFGREPVVGWYLQNGAWHYHIDQIDVTGWQKIDGIWYFFDSNGVMKTNWQKIDGKWYFFQPSGAMHTGWLQQGGSWYYLQKSGTMAVGWCQVDGLYRYFNENGVLKYSANKAGWIYYSGNWYYLSAGTAVTGWQKIDGIWYYFDTSGIMLTGWQEIGDHFYYMTASGAMATGWQKIAGKWFYLGTDGAMRSDWQLIGGKWYYFDQSGTMLTGFLTVDNVLYYLGPDGAMRTGWHKLDSTWYYMYPNGQVATGIVEVGSQTYLFTNQGKMLVGWVEDGQGNIYYANASGAMQTGWQQIDGYYFYFTRWGQLVQEAYVDNYLVNEYGVWVDTAPVNPDHQYYKHLTAQQAAQADAVAKAIAEDALAQGFETDIEKIAYAAEKVKDHVRLCEYQHQFDENYYYRSPYGVFIARMYTCAGSTRAMGRVLDFMGYTWYHYGENQYDHQWVCLRMDGEVGWIESQNGFVGYGKYGTNQYDATYYSLREDTGLTAMEFFPFVE